MRSRVVNFQIINTPIGYALIAATDKGLCYLIFGDSCQQLENNLKGNFPDNFFSKNLASMQKYTQLIDRYFQGQENDFRFTFDIEATAFQWAVWQRLLEIPIGKTLSYKNIAQSLGNYRSSRAVARACSSNPIGLIIPCHRVIQSDGKIGGYKWGVQRKLALLKLEQAMNSK